MGRRTKLVEQIRAKNFAKLLSHLSSDYRKRRRYDMPLKKEQ